MTRNERRPGRKRLEGRKVLCGTLFVLGIEHGSGLSVYRWVVEGAIALFRWFRRLRIRWEIRYDIHEAFLTLGCAVICWRRLRLSVQ